MDADSAMDFFNPRAILEKYNFTLLVSNLAIELRNEIAKNARAIRCSATANPQSSLEHPELFLQLHSSPIRNALAVVLSVVVLLDASVV